MSRVLEISGGLLLTGLYSGALWRLALSPVLGIVEEATSAPVHSIVKAKSDEALHMREASVPLHFQGDTKEKPLV